MVAFIHRVCGILGLFILSMSIPACYDDPGVTDPGCEPVPTNPPVPYSSLSVVDWSPAHGGRVLLNYKFTPVFIVADEAQQVGIDTVDLSQITPYGNDIVYSRGCFYGSSGDTLALSYFIITHDNDTITRAGFYSIRMGTLSEFMPSRCLPNGWDPVGKVYFYATGFDRVDGHERMILHYGNRYDLRDSTFREEEIDDPFDNVITSYSVTRRSMIACGITSRLNQMYDREHYLYTRTRAVELSGLFADVVYPTATVPETDYIVLSARPRDGVFADDRSWGMQVFIIDVAAIERGSSFREAIVRRYNLLQLNCMIAQYGFQVLASNGREIYVSMHRVGDPMQLPYALSIESPVRIRTVLR
jgi:hypothetical protein